MQKELNDKTLQLEAELASRTKAELQRLSQLEKDLREQEAELREQEKLQEELQEALTNKQRYEPFAAVQICLQLSQQLY